MLISILLFQALAFAFGMMMIKLDYPRAHGIFHIRFLRFFPCKHATYVSTGQLESLVVPKITNGF